MTKAQRQSGSNESLILVLVGTAELFVGTILALVAALGKVFDFAIPTSLQGVMSNLGIGLVAAGVITMTVEVMNRKRTKSDIAEIRDAHLETLLKGFIPPQLFEAIRSQIIQQPFIRTNYHTTLSLSWRSASHDYIVKNEVTVWDVENVSLTQQIYELRVGESNDCFQQLPEDVAIRSVDIERGEGQSLHLRGEALATQTIREAQFLRTTIPVPLKPTERVKILVGTSNIFRPTDVFNLHITGPAIGMKLNVTHPDDLAVGVYAMHPARHLLVKEMDEPTAKQWRFETGFLPFQGVKIYWAPANVANVHDA